jgi:hypothetical protein
MATVTPNNSWPVPTSTDYVKDGATAIEALGDAIDTSVGEGLLAYQTWAPTLSGSWANGNGTWTARYAQLGKTVFVSGRFQIGSTTTKGTTLVVSLPVIAQAEANYLNASVRFDPTGLNSIGTATLNGTSGIRLWAINVAGTYTSRANITATVPAVWTTGASFSFNFSYEAA